MTEGNERVLDCFPSLEDALSFQAGLDHPNLFPAGAQKIDQCAYYALFTMQPEGVRVQVYNEADLDNAINLARERASQ